VEFIQLLNKPDGENELLKWYEATDSAWSTGEHKDSPTGGSLFSFWRARFSERWPLVIASSRKRPAWAIEAES